MISPGTDATTQHVRWPAERFYWGLLDTSKVKVRATWSRQRLEERLGYLFEGVLPGVAVEDVHAVYEELPGGGRHLACAVPRSVLDEEVVAEAVTLTPEVVPPFADGQVEPARFNLLCGRYRPRAVRTLERRWILVVLLFAAAASGAVIFGLERRAAAVGKRIAALEAASHQMIQEALGFDAMRGSQPPSIRLTAERRRLEQTRGGDQSVAEVADVTGVVGKLLAAWPADVYVEAESITVTPALITIRGQVPTMADVQKLADSLGSFRGWRVQVPRSEAQRGRVEVTVQLQPAAEGEP